MSEKTSSVANLYNKFTEAHKKEKSVNITINEFHNILEDEIKKANNGKSSYEIGINNDEEREF